jgi:hypothetical protein
MIVSAPFRMLRSMKLSFSRSVFLRAVPALSLILTFAATESRADAAALKEARTALESLSSKNRAAPSVSFVFTSRVMGADGSWLPPAKGSLVTADSGRFRLRHAQGTVVCDGVTLWQHFPSTKQVVIRPARVADG